MCKQRDKYLNPIPLKFTVTRISLKIQDRSDSELSGKRA